MPGDVVGACGFTKAKWRPNGRSDRRSGGPAHRLGARVIAVLQPQGAYGAQRGSTAHRGKLGLVSWVC